MGGGVDQLQVARVCSHRKKGKGTASRWLWTSTSARLHVTTQGIGQVPGKDWVANGKRARASIKASVGANDRNADEEDARGSSACATSNAFVRPCWLGAPAWAVRWANGSGRRSIGTSAMLRRISPAG